MSDLTAPTGTGEVSCFERVECWRLACSSCGVIAFDDDSSEWAGVMHFDSIAQAAKIASEDDCGWFVAYDIAYCRSCLQKFGCLIDGHDWPEWHDHVSDRYVGRVRSCDRCDTWAWDPPLPDRVSS